MREVIYPIIEEKVAYNTRKGENREELIVLLILSFHRHILSGISTPIFSKNGLKALIFAYSYSLTC